MVKYSFYKKKVWEHLPEYYLISINPEYSMLSDLANCNIAYTRTIIKNIQKVIEGKKKMFSFGSSDYCTLHVYNKKTKIFYDFAENETEIDTADILKLMQDWYVFLESNGEKESSYPDYIQYDISYHFFLKEIENNKKVPSIEIEEPFKILEDFICLSDVSKIKEIIENIQLILELKKQDHYSFESKGSFIVYVLLFKTIISNEQEKKERNIETSDFLKLLQDWLGFLKK